MARIQILELPTVYRENGDDETPFVIVIDQADDAFRHALAPTNETMCEAQASLAEAIGARSILVFPGTVEIPANEVPVDPNGYPLKIRVEGDFEEFRAQVQDEIRKAQAEIGTAGLRRSV
jgi:hypothetical protein